MTPPLPYFDPRILSQLNGVKLSARGVVEGFVAGSHRSPFHGFAAEFAEHREYTPGDDLRYVDWKVFGRSDHVFVKQFESETNFACHLLLDASESMQFQSESAARSKLEFAKHIAAAICYVVVKQQDAVGLITFADTILQTVRPASQPAHWQQLSHLLVETKPVKPASATTSVNSAATNVANPRVRQSSVLSDVAERLTRPGVVLVLSDLFMDPDSLLHGLKSLRHRKHDVRVWQIVDPAEEEFPFDDPTLFRGLEGWADLSVDPRQLRQAYRAAFFSHREAIRRECGHHQIPFATLRTDQPIDAVVKQRLSS